MKTSKKLLAFAICLVMVAMLIPMSALAVDPLTIDSVTVADSATAGFKDVTVKYTAQLGVDQVTILGMIGTATAASGTYDNTTIAYIDQQAAGTTITVDGVAVTGFKFVVDEAKFTETNSYLFIKMGGTALTAAVGGTSGVLIKEVAAIVYGDVDGNGTVNVADAGLIVQKFFNKITEFPGANGAVAADVDGNGTINVADAGLVVQKFFNKISAFPIEQ